MTASPAHVLKAGFSIAGIDCDLVSRVHPQIAWAKLRALHDGAAIASKKVVELN